MMFCFRVTLEDLYKGKTTKIQLNKTVICKKCNGLVHEQCFPCGCELAKCTNSCAVSRNKIYLSFKNEFRRRILEL